MGNETTKKKMKWPTSYSSIPAAEVEQRLGFRMRNLKRVPTAIMLASAQYSMEADAVKQTKERVYQRIVEYLETEGYPTHPDTNFKAANINDMVYAIISPVLFDFMRTTGRGGIRLSREKVIISVDSQTGGNEEFVVVDEISVTEDKTVFIIEAKDEFVGQAMRQILLAMKDARGNGGGGVVYGFVTTGEYWQMLTCDGGVFRITENMEVFRGIGEDTDRWMKECSILVDCLVVSLSNGGIVKDVVVG